MSPATSLFIDFVRFSAALVVFLSHLTSKGINGVFPWVRWGHEAVVVFFVMSGFVIAHVVTSREQDAVSYAAARLGRLYSVVIPALVLTVFLDSVGMAISPALYSLAEHEQAPLRLLINLLFLQQNWNLTVMPLSNGPFWSLGFEFWYYAIFGVMTFLQGKARTFSVILLLLIAGPRITTFLPLWLLGAFAFRLQRKYCLSSAVTWCTAMLAAIAISLILAFGNPLVACREAAEAVFPDKYMHIFGGSGLFLGDIPYLPEDLFLGGLFATLLVCIRGKIRPQGWLDRLGTPIRFLSGSTFSLYLFHVPLLYFILTVFQVQKSSAGGLLFSGLAVMTVCLALSYIGERQVVAYRQFFSRALRRAFKSPSAA